MIDYIEFVGRDGAAATAEVWCPGPLARSVWVLTTDRPVVVKLASRTAPHREVEWSESQGKSRLLEQYHRLNSRFAPALSRGDWLSVLPTDIAALIDPPPLEPLPTLFEAGA